MLRDGPERLPCTGTNRRAASARRGCGAGRGLHVCEGGLLVFGTAGSGAQAWRAQRAQRPWASGPQGLGMALYVHTCHLRRSSLAPLLGAQHLQQSAALACNS